MVRTMLRKLRKNSWPIAASLLVHSLVVGLVLGSVSFEAPSMPNTVRVTIVENISDGTGTEGPVKPPASGTDNSSHAQLVPIDHKSFKAKKLDSYASTINKVEQPVRDPIIRETADD